MFLLEIGLKLNQAVKLLLINLWLSVEFLISKSAGKSATRRHIETTFISVWCLSF